MITGLRPGSALSLQEIVAVGHRDVGKAALAVAVLDDAALGVVQPERAHRGGGLDGQRHQPPHRLAGEVFAGLDLAGQGGQFAVELVEFLAHIAGDEPGGVLSVAGRRRIARLQVPPRQQREGGQNGCRQHSQDKPALRADAADEGGAREVHGAPPQRRVKY
ncbi:MAG: hypothetical protein NVV74_23370 [Magnetospirillum sp.]|nr:hypothetical protein [Magnetospirillum sp.]